MPISYLVRPVMPKRTRRPQDKMMLLDPNSREFKLLLLEIAERSDHPNDVAIAKILREELGIGWGSEESNGS